MYYDDASSFEQIFCGKRRIARKEHTCCECGRIIKVGEGYFYFVGLLEDPGDLKFATYKTCAMCESDWREILNVFCGDLEAVRAYGFLRQAIQEAYDKRLLSESDSLVGAWLDIMRERREKETAVGQMRTFSAPLL